MLLPLAVLGLLGAGFGAYAVGQGPPAAEPLPVGSGSADTGAADTGAADTGAAETTPAPAEPEPASGPGQKPDPLPEPLPEAPLEPDPEEVVSPTVAALEQALRQRRVVVAAFYTPDAGLDGAVLREARAGAKLARAGFISVNVTRERAVSELAREFEVLEAPAVIVFLRGPRVASRFDRYADRETVAQAVENALR